MRFVGTSIQDAYIVEAEPHADERGLFARTFCRDEFAKHGLSGDFAQCSVSWNDKKATLRGLHYQAAPQEENKLVRVTRGSVYDVAVDLRVSSPTYLKWFGVELTHDRHNAFYIPAGCAHGFITLEDDSEVFYQISTSYVPELSRCVRWDDPLFAIDWPLKPHVISERDAGCDFYREGKTNV